MVVRHGAALLLRCRVLKRRRLIRFMGSPSTVTIETISERAPTVPPPPFSPSLSENRLIAKVWGDRLCSCAALPVPNMYDSQLQGLTYVR